MRVRCGEFDIGQLCRKELATPATGIGKLTCQPSYPGVGQIGKRHQQVFVSADIKATTVRLRCGF